MACLLLVRFLLTGLTECSLFCHCGAVGDERHLVFECAALASLQSTYAGLLIGSSDVLRSSFAQPDHYGDFPLRSRLSGF